MSEFVHLNPNSAEFQFDLDPLERDLNTETCGNAESSAKFLNFCRPETEFEHSDFRLSILSLIHI